MAASALTTAQELYDYACGNPARIAEVAAAFDAAVSAGVLTRGGSSDLTSASKNGVSYQKTVGLSEVDRRAALRIARACLSAGVRPSSRSYVRF